MCVYMACQEYERALANSNVLLVPLLLRPFFDSALGVLSGHISTYLIESEESNHRFEMKRMK